MITRRLFLFAVATLISPATHAAELIPAAVVLATKGDVKYRANPADPLRAVKTPRTLLTGAQLFLAPGASLTLKDVNGTEREFVNRFNVAPEEPDYEVAPMALPIAAALERSYVAATYRAGCVLFSPAHGGNLPTTEPLELRWEPLANVERLRFAVFGASRKIYETQLDASLGRATPDGLLAALQAAAADRETTLFFLCHPADRAPREEDTVALDLLGSADATALARDLAACGPAAGPWYRPLRARVWSHRGVHHRALAELELALEDPVHARNRKLVTSAADLADATGAKRLAAHWRALARSLPADDELPAATP
jgi:hypothetical protein